MSLRIYGRPLVVTDSGGKDSAVCREIVRRAGIPFELHHNLTTADAPQTIYYVRKIFREYESKGIPCSIHYPYYKGQRVSMWSLIPMKRFPPTRLQRYCCEILYRKKVLMERNRENSCFYRTFPLFSFHNTFITSVQDLSAKTKGHRFFAMMLFHLLKFLCLLFQKLPVSFLHRLWHKPLLW